jgi:ABC-type Zn2+ transport system substrate-binding protein/surface adhesin
VKLHVLFSDKKIPVYFDSKPGKKKARNIIEKLLEVLETKAATGKKTLKKFLDTLDSIEIVDTEAILFSKTSTDTLALSIF